MNGLVRLIYIKRLTKDLDYLNLYESEWLLDVLHNAERNKGHILFATR